MQAVEDFRRRAGRREHAEPAAAVRVVGQPRFGGGGHIGHLWMTLAVGVGECAQFAGLELRQHRRRRGEHHLCFTRHGGGHRRARALVRDVQNGGAGACVKKFARQVQGIADARRAI